MKILIAIIIVPVIIFIGFYDIKFLSNNSCYDIMVLNRWNRNYGWGVVYREGFEIWQFSENIHRGMAECRIYSKEPNKYVK